MVMILEIKYYYLATLSDATKIINQSEKYEFLAKFDELTKLPNRRAIKTRFDNKVNSNSEFALVMLDIDNFKEINDKYGHDIGDKILQYFAPKLNKFNNDSDLVARYGGDEFIFILKVKSKKSFEKKISSIEKLFSNPININNHQIEVFVSLGISIYPTDANNFDEMFKNADEALYAAKKTRGNKIVYFK